MAPYYTTDAFTDSAIAFMKSTPFIAHWPNVIKEKAGEISHSKGYLIDLMPTLLDAANIDYPANYNGIEIHPNEGHSLLALFTKDTLIEHEYMFWEFEDHCAIRKGDLKAIKDINQNKWRLYNIGNDRIESTDISANYPELIHELDSLWNDWANTHYVFPKKPEVPEIGE